MPTEVSRGMITN